MSEQERQAMLNELTRANMDTRKKWYSAGIITILMSAGGIIFAIGSWEGTEGAFRKDTVNWQRKYEPIIDNSNLYVSEHQDFENKAKMKRINEIKINN